MTVSAEVAAALAASGLTREAEGCLGTLSEGEGGVSFNTLYGGGLWRGSLDHFPTSAEWPGGTGPEGDPTSAFGFLQFERKTYAECTAATGLAGIDPQSQIANGWWLAQHDFAKRTGGGSLLAALQGNRLAEVAGALLSTWPGGAAPNPNPRTGYPGFPAAYAAFMAATTPPSSPAPITPPNASPIPYSVPVSGGKLSVTIPAICSAAISADGRSIDIEPLAAGAAVVIYTVTIPVVVRAVLTAEPG